MYGWFLSLFNLLLSKNFFLNYFEILLPWLLSTGYLSDIIMVTSSWWYHSWWHWSQYLEFYGPILIKNSWKLSKYWPKLANVYKQSSNFSSNYQKFQLKLPKYLHFESKYWQIWWFLEAPPSYKREPIWPIPQSRSKTETDNNSQLLKLW